MRFLITFILGFVLLLSQVSFAQDHHHKATVSGIVTSEDGEPMIGVMVYLKNTSKGTQSDIDGSYTISGIEAGSYQIIFSLLSYKTDSLSIKLDARQHLKLDRTMLPDLSDHVEVIAKTDNEIVKEQSYNVDVIDASKYANTNSDINQVLNQSTGIRVRQEGGLGSTFNFMLNGFSGNQIRYFIDGIPMTNFGEALTLNNIPINAADRIEIYKGVVPVWLGADALGGAINIVTNQKIRNFVDASYSYGSFNTHRASLNSRYTDSSGFTVNLSGYANYSDNNFTITTSIPDPSSGKFGPQQKFKHFHDQYKSAAGILEIGVVDKKYADRLLFGVIVSGNYKETQQGQSMKYVYGEAFRNNFTVIPTVKYSKSNFLLKGLTLTAFGSINFGKNNVVDTCSRKYNWDGSYQIAQYNQNRGEISSPKSLYRYNDRSAFAMTTVNYDITKHHNLSFNYTYSNMVREQRDDLNPNRFNFSTATLERHIIALGYKLTALENRFSGTIFIKRFLLNAELPAGTELLKINLNQGGYGAAVSYFLIRNMLQAKISVENTSRVPDDAEYLGNGQLVIPNPYLKPEHSKNLNIGLRFSKQLSKSSQLAIEGGFVYRNAINFIRQVSDGAPISQYRNENNVRVTGFEAGIQYNYKKMFFFDINGTYQNIINVDKYSPPGTQRINYLYMLRLPNIPYFFANANLGLKINKVGPSDANLYLNLSLNYIEGFYLYWPTLGNPIYKREIPTQFTQNVTVTYALHDNRYNISFECRNITNVALYDYFNVQKPGRAFSIKIRYFFKKSNKLHI